MCLAQKTAAGSLAVVLLAAVMASGCAPSEPDCNNPRNQEEQQQCAHKASTESRIEPTKNPQNWLELNKQKR